MPMVGTGTVYAGGTSDAIVGVFDSAGKFKAPLGLERLQSDADLARLAVDDHAHCITSLSIRPCSTSMSESAVLQRGHQLIRRFAR